MSSPRYFAAGIAVRTSGRWAVRHRHPAWSPLRWILLLVLRVVPVRMLGFLGWHGVVQYRRRLWHGAPEPATAIALVLVWIAIALVRDELPEPVRKRLLG